MKAQKKANAAATPKAKTMPKTVSKKKTTGKKVEAKGDKKKAALKRIAQKSNSALRKAAAAFLAEATIHAQTDIEVAQSLANKEKRAYEFGFLITADVKNGALKLRHVSCDYAAEETFESPDNEWTLRGAIDAE